ncbi:hypothetical protein GY45DRAFT_1329952 [Cubamyces sp. BRFM 1775]|nr:hypothetical protein GY45DRAFT_1329952 [Cubamyces sp. BRFM 1775]
MGVSLSADALSARGGGDEDDEIVDYVCKCNIPNWQACSSASTATLRSCVSPPYASGGLSIYGACSGWFCGSTSELNRCIFSSAGISLQGQLISIMQGYCPGYTPPATTNTGSQTQPSPSSGSSESQIPPITTQNSSTTRSSPPTATPTPSTSIPASTGSLSHQVDGSSSHAEIISPSTTTLTSSSSPLGTLSSSLTIIEAQTTSSITSTSGPAKSSPPYSSSNLEPAQHGSHAPTAAIASATGGVVALLAFVVVLFLCLRRIRRGCVGTKCIDPQIREDGPESSSIKVPLSKQHILDSSMKRPGTPWEAPIEWDVITRARPQDVLVPSRAVTPNPQSASFGSSSENRSLLRHSTVSSSIGASTIQSSSTGEVIERGDLYPTLECHAERPVTVDGLTVRPLRGSWGSDRDTVASDIDEEPIADASGAGWHPSRMVRPPPASSYNMTPEGGIASSELARRRDSVSCTNEWGETAMAL